MNSPILTLQSRGLSSPGKPARIAGVRGRPGVWDRANFLLALAGVLAGVVILSAKLAGTEPCFQSPSGNCGQTTQIRAQPELAPAYQAGSAEAGLAL